MDVVRTKAKSLLFMLHILVVAAKPEPPREGDGDQYYEGVGENTREDSPKCSINHEYESNSGQDEEKVDVTWTKTLPAEDDTASKDNITPLSPPKTSPKHKHDFTNTFGSPGPPSLKLLDDFDYLSLQGNGQTSIKMEGQIPSKHDDRREAINHMEQLNDPVSPARPIPSMSTLSQDDMTLDAVMGRPPRITTAGRIMQIQQEERTKTKIPGSTDKIEDTKSGKRFETDKKQSDDHEDIMKYIKDLAHSMKQPVPSVKLFDAAVVYDRTDYESVVHFMDIMRTVAFEELKEDFRIELFDSEEFAQSMVMVVADVIERCSVVFVYLTNNCDTDFFRLFCDEAVGLSRLGLNNLGGSADTNNQKWMLKPVHTQPPKSRRYKTPVGLLTLRGIDWFDWPSTFVHDKVKALLKTAIHIRKSNEVEQNISLRYKQTFGQLQDNSRPSLPPQIVHTAAAKSMPTAQSMDAISFSTHHNSVPQYPGNQYIPHNQQLLGTIQHNRHTPDFRSQQRDQRDQRIPQSYQIPQVAQNQHQGYRQQPNMYYGAHTPNTSNPMYAQELIQTRTYGPMPQSGLYRNQHHGYTPAMQHTSRVPSYHASLMQDELSYQPPNSGQNLQNRYQEFRPYPSELHQAHQYRPQQMYLREGQLNGVPYQNGQSSHPSVPDQANMYQPHGAYYARGQNQSAPQHVSHPPTQNNLYNNNPARTAQNGAEYGLLMRDKRHDTPSSSDLNVVSRLTGKLIVNPDLSNTDLEIDMNEALDTGLLEYQTTRKTSSDDTNESSDDSVEESDGDSDDDASIGDLIPDKGKVVNIIGSKVVQLGKNNKSVEKYQTKRSTTRMTHQKKTTENKPNVLVSDVKCAVLERTHIPAPELMDNLGPYKETDTTNQIGPYSVGVSKCMEPYLMDDIHEEMNSSKEHSVAQQSSVLRSVNNLDQANNSVISSTTIPNKTTPLSVDTRVSLSNADKINEYSSSIDNEIDTNDTALPSRVRHDTPQMVNNLNQTKRSKMEESDAARVKAHFESLTHNTVRCKIEPLETHSANGYISLEDNMEDIPIVVDANRNQAFDDTTDPHVGTEDDMFGAGRQDKQPHASFGFSSYRTCLFSKSNTSGTSDTSHHNDTDLCSANDDID